MLNFKTMNALFLVAGTCIGGGMLALPIASSAAGFWPAASVMLLSCVFMTLTGLLFLEATLWMQEGAHIITLSSRLLNKSGMILSLIVYLFISYASLVAYVSGGGKELSFVSKEIFSLPVSSHLGSLFYILVFGGAIYLGSRFVERVNTLLFIGMIVAYIFMIHLGFTEIDSHLLQRRDWDFKNMLFLIPLMLTTFSFPGIVPTIVPYLKRDVKALKIAIIGGTAVTFLVYLIWLLLIFGSVPHEGAHGLKEAFECDVPATECLHYAIQNPWLSYVAQFFAFFALTTSFLGIALALFDFLADAMKVSKKGKGKVLLTFLIAIPTLFFAIAFRRAFITALELSGGIGDAIISGIIPVLMIWRGRYILNVQTKGDYQVAGGKGILALIALASLIILACELTRRIL